MNLYENCKLKPEVKTKWVEALRSKKYKQGCCYLRTKTNDFCCLGVLYDVLEPDGWIAVDGPYYIKDAAGNDNTGYDSCLSDRIEEMAGLTNKNSVRLANANDAGVNFEEIANAIEAKL
jgi:hypothetical protein